MFLHIDNMGFDDLSYASSLRVDAAQSQTKRYGDPLGRPLAWLPVAFAAGRREFAGIFAFRALRSSGGCTASGPPR